MIAFELARSVRDLHAIFGDSANECRFQITSELDWLTWFDSLLFIPAYGTFLVVFFSGARPLSRALSRGGLLVTALAVPADYLENAVSAPDLFRTGRCVDLVVGPAVGHGAEVDLARGCWGDRRSDDDSA